MNRRQFLTTAGIVGTVVLAGCTTGDNGNENGTGAGTLPDERVDQPPHSPERPPENDEDWDDHYLGEGMDTEPSLPFEEVSATLDERELGGPPDEEYAVTLVSSEAELGSRFDLAASDDRLQAVDFDEETVVVVESGYGSSSVRHAWKRAEAVDAGVHLNGYQVTPLVQLDDITARHSVVIVEQVLGDDDIVHASLTIAEDRRVNVDSDDGVVTLKPEADNSGGTGPD